MKKMLMVLVVTLLSVGCSGGGGDGGANTSIGEVTEGTGPTLDISKTTDAAKYVDSVITAVQNGFDMADNQTASGDATKGMMSKSTGSESEIFSKICAGNSYSKEISVTLKSLSGGTAQFTGNISASPSGSDGLLASIDLSSEFKDYGAGLIKFSGNTKKSGSGGFTKGIKVLCSGQVTAETQIEGSSSETYSGALSISGEIGAAISYKYTTANDFTSLSEGGLQNIKIEGTAEFKSGGKVVTCTIGHDPSPDADIDNYVVSCI